MQTILSKLNKRPASDWGNSCAKDSSQQDRETLRKSKGVMTYILQVNPIMTSQSFNISTSSYEENPTISGWRHFQVLKSRIYSIWAKRTGNRWSIFCSASWPSQLHCAKNDSSFQKKQRRWYSLPNPTGLFCAKALFWDEKRPPPVLAVPNKPLEVPVDVPNPKPVLVEDVAGWLKVLEPNNPPESTKHPTPLNRKRYAQTRELWARSDTATWLGLCAPKESSCVVVWPKSGCPKCSSTRSAKASIWKIGRVSNDCLIRAQKKIETAEQEHLVVAHWAVAPIGLQENRLLTSTPFQFYWFTMALATLATIQIKC